jgi:hypothetical protein
MIVRLLSWLRSRRQRPSESADPQAIYRAQEAARKRLARAARRIEEVSGRASGRVRTRPDTPHIEESKIQEKYIKTRAHTIPENWRPDDEGLQLGIQAFGADGVETAIARHRNVWSSRPERLTEKQWQSKWKAWCLQHIAPGLPIPQLVTRRAKEDLTPDARARVYIKSDTDQWEAWTAYRGGKSLPMDKTGGWRVPTEWPPGYVEAQEQRRESG